MVQLYLSQVGSRSMHDMEQRIANTLGTVLLRMHRYRPPTTPTCARARCTISLFVHRHLLARERHPVATYLCLGHRTMLCSHNTFVCPHRISMDRTHGMWFIGAASRDADGSKGEFPSCISMLIFQAQRGQTSPYIQH